MTHRRAGVVVASPQPRLRPAGILAYPLAASDGAAAAASGPARRRRLPMPPATKSNPANTPIPGAELWNGGEAANRFWRYAIARPARRAGQSSVLHDFVAAPTGVSRTSRVRCPEVITRRCQEPARSSQRSCRACRIAIGVLTRTFPPGLVDRALATTRRTEQRRRLLPARVVVYYTLASACLPRWATRRSCGCWSRAWRGPGHGWGQRRCGRCSPRSPGRWPPRRPRVRGIAAGGWWRWTAPPWTWRTPRPPGGVRRAPWGPRPGAFPQVRLVGLVECGTHAVLDAALGGLQLGERSLAPSRRLLVRSTQGCCWSTRACAAWSCGAPCRRRGGAAVALPPG
jgi:hypothetical protein